MEHGTHLPDEQRYIVHNLKEIIQILTDLSRRKVTLNVSFNDGNDVYLTTVIEVDTKNHAVHLDIGRDEAFNSRLLASQHVVFLKEDGVRIKWASKNLSVVTLKDGKAIKIALPQNLIRLQRREFFRIATPLANPVLCQIPMPNETDPEVKETLELALVDVSLGGIGLIASDPLHLALVGGVSFDGCKINFPDVGMASLTLQVQNVIPMTMKDGAMKYRIGLQYVEPSRGNEGLIHRYTFNLERLAMAIAKDE